jgi:bifunctional UDP-N-acetylglucosamine pyrophosphorylase/glucosamine-1-phosphate N-acetyltransferase
MTQTLAAAIVLAAGEGKRMRSATPKVLHEVVGRSLLGHVLAAVDHLKAARTLVVVGHGREAVTAALPEGVEAVVQDEQWGTGHAVQVVLEAVPALTGPVLVLYGDCPLLTPETLRQLVNASGSGPAAMLTAHQPDPTGYGRVIRDQTGAVRGIVEERDATEEQRSLTETNPGVYIFDAASLREALADLTPDNSQGELYLTDVIASYVAKGDAVATVVADAAEVAGVNDRAQLAAAGASLRERTLLRAMQDGATIVDPTTTWVDVTVTLEPDSTVLPFTTLHGATSIAAGAVVGPYADLTDTVVGPRATVRASTCVGAEIGEEASVGPYSYLRPGTRLGPRAKAGGFVEMKNAELGEGTKVPHLSYVGDARIGRDVNVSAGAITANYDGVHKSVTTIGDNAFIGSDSLLVAPVTVGDDAYVAGGSTITDDVPPGALGVGRGRQRNVEGWVARRRKRQSDEGTAQ